jgi:hypothetical protein
VLERPHLTKVGAQKKMNFVKSITSDVTLDVAQPQFGKGYHDSIQYHFFCGTTFFSMRVFNTKNFTHHSAWVFDGQARELLNVSEPLKYIGSERLNLQSSRFLMEGGDHDGKIAIMSPARKNTPIMEVRFKNPNTFVWSCFGTPAIHQTHLEGEIIYNGQTFRGVGYCKRYWWDENIEFWGYRFVQGVCNPGYMIWTADATFGNLKYAYFKIAQPNGILAVAEEKNSSHRNDTAFGVIDGVSYDIQLTELGVWETVLRSKDMESKMRQRFCEMTVTHDGRTDKGFALNETCFGTIR